MKYARMAALLAGSVLVSASVVPARADTALPDATVKAATVHNDYRARHGVPDLLPSAELEKGAQAWADRGEFEHSDWQTRKAGENLYASSEPCTEGDLKKATDLWYSEIKDYDFSHPDTVAADQKEFDKGVGHFTQVVWKGSKELGVGIASHPGKRYKCLIVARYSPSGNYMGDFRENVLPPKA